MDRFGIRKTMIGVVIALGITCMGASKVYNFWTLLLAFFFLRFLGQGALTLLSNNILAMWFSRRLGLASGIKSQAGALSMGLLPGAILWSIQSFGWRETFVYMGFTIWILLLPLLLLFFRNRPEDIGLLPDGESFPNANNEDEPPETTPSKNGNEMAFRDVLRTPTYWILLGINIIWGMIATAIIFHLVSIFESNQLTEKQAASCLFIFAMSIAAFQFLGGWLADHFRPTPLITVCLIGMACGTFCLVPLSYSFFIGVAFAILFGGSQGALNSIGNTVWPRFYGRANLGKIRGTIWTAAVIGSSAGPWLLSIMAEFKEGNFDLGLTVLALIFIPFIIASIWIRPPQIQTQ